MQLKDAQGHRGSKDLSRDQTSGSNLHEFQSLKVLPSLCAYLPFRGEGPNCTRFQLFLGAWICSPAAFQRNDCVHLGIIYDYLIKCSKIQFWLASENTLLEGNGQLIKSNPCLQRTEARRALIRSLVKIELPKYFWSHISLLPRFNAAGESWPQTRSQPRPLENEEAVSQRALWMLLAEGMHARLIEHNACCLRNLHVVLLSAVNVINQTKDRC